MGQVPTEGDASPVGRRAVGGPREAGVLVIGATVVGLVGVLSFHTSPSKLTLGRCPVRHGTPRAADHLDPGRCLTTDHGPATASPTTTPAAGPDDRPPTTAAPTDHDRTVHHPFGDRTVRQLQLRRPVGHGDRHRDRRSPTCPSRRSTTAGTPAPSRSTSSRSRSSSSRRIQAQSANIQGVSGASYTSSGFQQSLQAALGQLGFK